MKRRSLLRFAGLLAAYLVVAIPFKAMNLIPGFTDVRPVMALGPVYGIFFGPVGCLACGFGNLLADAVDHAIRWTSIAGFASNAIVAPAVAIVYPEVDSVFLAWAVFGNTAGFPILLGIPLSILLQEELDIQPAGRSGAAPDDPRGDREPRRRSPGTPESPAP